MHIAIPGIYWRGLAKSIWLTLLSCCLKYPKSRFYRSKSINEKVLPLFLSRSNGLLKISSGQRPLKIYLTIQPILVRLFVRPDHPILELGSLFFKPPPALYKVNDARPTSRIYDVTQFTELYFSDTFFLWMMAMRHPISAIFLPLCDDTLRSVAHRYTIYQVNCSIEMHIINSFIQFTSMSKWYEIKNYPYYDENSLLNKSDCSLHKPRQVFATFPNSCNTDSCPPYTPWNYSCIRVDLKFTRDDAFYFSTVFFPGIILVTSSFITFWLEWNAVPARVMIGVTTMLNFFTTSNSFRATLPVVSNLSAMNTWDSVCMGFIYVSLLEFVVVNYVGRKRPKHNMVYMPGENAVTQRIPQAIHRIGLSLVSGWTERKRPAAGTGGCVGMTGVIGVNANLGDDIQTNRNAHEMVSCANCGNQQCTHANAPNNCPNGEEPAEVSQVEYTFKQHNDGDAESECCPCNYYCCPTGACPGNPRRASSASNPNKKDPPHPIRVAKSIDVVSRIVFPLGFTIFLFYFFSRYKGYEYHD
ncbi:unnamed protein product, partial [Meganyctiphanes norvegica]